eukprot:TRINITY_DN5776_c0_g1_i3.p1 TRINITY_DN5776_c0_g1~~TRINITY_DN5776_c0_g1_i3.p1  ORF type:complete len:832 (-),score=284.28 TRINITY_DN5776_c0_g1_i3:130-2625(-)
MSTQLARLKKGGKGKEKDPGEEKSIVDTPPDILRYQNKALANKVDYLRKELRDLNTKYERESKATKQNRRFIAVFSAAWLKFVHDVKFLADLLKIDAENGTKQWFDRYFEFLAKLNAFGDGRASEREENGIGGQSDEAAMQKLVEEFFRDLQAAFSAFFVPGTTTREGDTKMEEENVARKATATELPGTVRQLEEILRRLAGPMSIIEIADLRNENDTLRQLNENLSRRVRKMLDYDGKVINQKIEQEDLSYECICGGEFFHQTSRLIARLEEELKNNQESAAAAPSKMEEEEKKPTDQVEGGQEEIEDQMSLLTKDEIIKNNEKIIEDLKKGVTVLSEENKKLTLELENLELVFYNSKTYNSLMITTEENLKRFEELRDRYEKALKTIEDIESLRRKEIEEMRTTEEEEKLKLRNELKKAMNEVTSLRGQVEILENATNADSSLNRIKMLLENLNEADKGAAILNEEIQNLRKQNRGLKEELNAALSERNSLHEKFNDLKMKFETLQAQGNSKVLEQLVHRNQKFSDFLNEWLVQSDKQELGIRDKILELKAYLKNREEKSESYKQKAKRLQVDLAAEKRQYEHMFSDADMTGNAYQEMTKKNKGLTTQVAEQAETIAKLTKEKTQEKTQFESERHALGIRIKALTDMSEAQKKLNAELDAKIKVLADQLKLGEDLLAQQKEYNRRLLKEKEELLRRIEDSKLEGSLSRGLHHSIEHINKRMLKENEELKIKLQEKQNFINEKFSFMKGKDKDWSKKPEEVKLMEYYLEKYKRIALCTVCEKRTKSVLLTKCLHVFCRKCVDKQIEIRERKCPICRKAFGTEDCKTLYLE